MSEDKSLERAKKVREMQKRYQSVKLEDFDRITTYKIQQLAIEHNARKLRSHDLERISKTEAQDECKEGLSSMILLIKQNVLALEINRTRIEDLTNKDFSSLEDEALKTAQEIVETGAPIPYVSKSDIEASIQKLKLVIEQKKRRNREELKVQQQKIQEALIQKKSYDDTWNRRVSSARKTGQAIGRFFRNILNLILGRRLRATEVDIKEANIELQQTCKELEQQIGETYQLVRNSARKTITK